MEMTRLKYKTRGNISPQGKARVFFCCHPDDFNSCFETISNEILAMQNCSIWYIDEAVDRGEDFLEDLKQMQLFIMPVTTKLLCTGNSAIDVEFPFAVENHIPVLPLMQEGGLEDLFNKKCGDLQFLDKHNVDITAINYDEKLKKYLESVLVGDELAEKIRAAFDAYVFLSYRKKDRKYAQELMRLIHKNDFCRDIAIWYDEFLTPGENFNDSIKEALQKSGLFVLTVTPNLVNEPNYIMTTEYPMARQQGKPILPAELLPTDRKQLSEKYVGIPKLADAHNETELSEALLESIKKIAIKENDASPEHSFFIGLAYLSGIDVEVNHERALSLIMSAAEAGLVEAQKKLVSMYLEGIGVARCFDSAICWQRKVVETLKDQVFDCDSAIDHAKEVYGLGDILTSCIRINEALDVYNGLISACDGYFSKYLSYHFVRLKAGLLLSIGDLYKANGKTYAAKAYYKEAMSLYESQKNQANFSKNFLFLVAGRLGEICAISADSEGARKNFALALDLCNNMSETDTSFNKHLMLSIAYNNLALVYERELDTNKAEELINLAIDEAQHATKILGILNTYPHYFATVMHLSNLYSRMQRDEKAIISLIDLKDLCSEVYVKTGRADAKRWLARVYKNIASCSESDFEKAQSYYAQALEIYSELVNENNSYADKVHLIKVCCCMGSLLNSQKAKTSVALQYYERAYSIIEDVGVKNFTDDDLVCVEDYFSGVGAIYYLKGENIKARTSYLSAISAAQTRENGGMEERYKLAYEHVKVAETYYMELDRDNSIRYYSEAVCICKSIQGYENVDKVVGLLSACYDWLGIIYKLKQDIDEAEKYYNMSHEMNQKLVVSNPSYNNRRNIALYNFKIGEIAELRGDIIKATKDYKKCVHLCLELSREFSYRQCYADLAAAYHQLANVEEKIENLKKAYSIISQLSEQFPDVSLYAELTRYYKKDLEECNS